MTEQERLTEVAALLAEYDRKMEEADVVRKKIHAALKINSSVTRKKSTRRPEDIIREVLQ